MVQKRRLEIVVISDVHLGTFGCHAKELCSYLESIDPEILILNGDIIDFWQLKFGYWPASHMRVLELTVEKASQGKQVTYLTGNHDDVLRKFSDVKLGNFSLVDKLVLTVDGKTYWFFHGDVLDSLILKARFLAQLGTLGYDMLILLNRFFNKIMDFLGRPRVSLSKKIKNGVKQALLHIQNFENTIADLSLSSKYDAVVCGHIHAPVIKNLSGSNNKGSVLYLNSGDWIENLTALEFVDGEWKIYEHSNREPIKSVEIFVHPPLE